MKLKVILFAIACVGLSYAKVHAQDSEDVFSIGPRIGVNFANVSNVEDSKASIGLAFGVTSTYSLSEAFGVTIDLLYSQEGYEIDGIDDEVSLDYLRIPLLFDVFFGDLGESFRPKVYVGLVPGILLKAEQGNVDLEDVTNSFVLDLGGGLGFNYRLAERVWLNVDGRAIVGLSDLRHEDFRVGDDKVTNQVVQLSAGVAFGL